jgi:hypothetical protein
MTTILTAAGDNGVSQLASGEGPPDRAETDGFLLEADRGPNAPADVWCPW